MAILLYKTFVDFEKAFDSVDRDVIWRLIIHYGIPPKLINIIQGLYKDLSCQVIHSGKLTKPFVMKTGVRQVYILSPTIFLIVIDWIMLKTTHPVDLPKQLEELDFADDISHH